MVSIIFHVPGSHNFLFFFHSPFKARRALQALRGLVRLKSLIHGSACKRQATTTLRCMQTLAKVQSQIRSRRIRMSEENQALQRQLLLKREKELEALRVCVSVYHSSLDNVEKPIRHSLGDTIRTVYRNFF